MLRSPAETVNSEIEAAYSKLKNQVKIDGFRKGKVPPLNPGEVL